MPGVLVRMPRRFDALTCVDLIEQAEEAAAHVDDLVVRARQGLAGAAGDGPALVLANRQGLPDDTFDAAVAAVALARTIDVVVVRGTGERLPGVVDSRVNVA